MNQGMYTQIERPCEVHFKLCVHRRLGIHLIFNTLIKNQQNLKQAAPEDCKNVPCVTYEGRFPEFNYILSEFK